MIAWTQYADERLLEERICDLDLQIERTPLAPRVARLYEELDARGITFKPRCWLSNEWFSPDGTPGIALPFYLSHPRLMRLEKQQMLVVEGGNQRSCMMLLRHEAGHALDTAYRLHYRKRWRESFGRFTEPYPRHYRPNPNSRNYVLHLDSWYAQAHPAEDWAETFAVWLTPRSGWRSQYASWPVARRKLEFVDELMSEIAGKAPAVKKRARVDHVSTLRQTLGDYYADKRDRYKVGWSAGYDEDLQRIFSIRGRETAVQFLRRNRREIRDSVARWTGAHRYTVDQVLEEVIDRCRQLRLRVALPKGDARMQAAVMLTVHTMNSMKAGRHEIPV